ncbi:uncharacterized protein RCC_12068 [Ramularia collo-cygni]|uniref:Ubiquitin-like domain-containing protein n=1 Tax=Ramularia collo-cygni TaxID=112498 RepID=A0A2D3V111_9PEZI|nr:uncharacterized protein RCC_12068 [Ramularia collo-cygni]CZT15189.1 uncharacterized protein RCC_12068 [Ramularia collo-cygni]
MAQAVLTNGLQPWSKIMFDSISSFFENPAFSDCTVKCSDKTWDAHKVVLGGQSEIFATRLSDPSGEPSLNLSEDHQCIVHEMMRYLYTGDYEAGHSSTHTSLDDGHTEPSCCFTPILFSVHMRTIADKWEIPALAQLTEAKIADQVLEVSDWDIDDFANAIEEMYTTDSENKKNMQALAVRAAVPRAYELYNKTLGGKRFREVAEKIPVFASELARVLARKKRTPKKLVKRRRGVFQITVETVTLKRVSIDLEMGDIVLTIKELLQEIQGIPPEDQVLSWANKNLDDGRTVGEYGIGEGAVIRQNLKLRGS